MASANNQKQMRAESEALIRLGMLLRRPRSPEGKQEVQQILDSAATSAEKVRRIREFDRKNGVNGGEDTAESKRHYVSVDAETPAVKARQKARRPPRVTAPLARLGYLPFLFRHRLRIKEFGRSTHTITGSGFPPRVKLSDDVPAFLLGFVKPTAKDVTTLLSQLMGNAWMYLTKHDYNLLILVLDLCDKIERMAIDAGQIKSGKIGTRLGLVEDRLLSIRYNEESIPRILESIEVLTSHNRRSIANLAALPDMVTRLISRTSEKPSLIDTILAINMVKYRRYLTEKDMTLTSLGELVDRQAFDCSDATHGRIDDFLDRLAVQLEALAEEQRQVMKVRALIEKDEQGHIVLTSLERLVQAHTGYSWQSALDHPPQLAEGLFAGFAAHVEELFAKSLGLEEVGTVKLLNGTPFRPDLDRLERVVDVIQRNLVDLQMLRRERLVALRDKRESASRFEAEFLMQLQLGLDIVGQIRDHLAPLLDREAPTSRNFESIDFRAIGSDEGALPLAAVIVGGAPDFRGYSLRQAIETVIRNGHLICFVFGDKKIRNLLNREQQIRHDAEHMIESVRRIAISARAEEIVSIYQS